MPRPIAVRMTEFKAARPEDRAQLARLIAEGQSIIRRHAGCIRCEVLLDDADPTLVMGLELWRDHQDRAEAGAAIPGALVQSALAIMSADPVSRSLAIPPEFNARD